MSKPVAAIALVLAAALTGCGEQRGALADAIPEDLQGSWEAVIEHDELDVPPDGLQGTRSVWRLRFLRAEGDDGKLTLSLSNQHARKLVRTFSVSRRTITLESEPTCQQYSFEVAVRVGRGRYPEREKLYLEPVDQRGGCPSTPLGSALAARGWTRVDGPLRPAAAASAEEWPLERIRDEGSLEDETRLRFGLTARTYVVCDGPPSKCHGDGSAREPFEHAALELTRGRRSVLFSLADDDHVWVTARDETSVFVMDDAQKDPDADVLRYRLMRLNGTEVPLSLVRDPVPAVPGDDVLVIDYSESADPEAVQHAFLLDERKGTLRPLDLPRNGNPDRLLAGRFWGPNTDEFLWFVYVDCRVYWVTGGTLHKRRLDCSDDFEFNWSGGDFTYVHSDLFPDGWLEPGRMALIERVDGRLILHASLDGGATWRRIRVSDEAAVPGALRRLG